MSRWQLRIGAAVAVLVGGLVHLQLYFLGYRSYPDPNLGRSFIANSVLSTIVASLLVVRSDRIIRVIGVCLALASLASFALTRWTDVVFGFTEKGLNPSPQAAIALVAEIVAVALLSITFFSNDDNRPAERRFPTAIATAAAVVVVVVVVVAGAVWAREYGRTDPEPVLASPAETVPVEEPVASETTVAGTLDAPSNPSSTTSATTAETSVTSPLTTAEAPDSTATTVGATPPVGLVVTISDFAFDPEFQSTSVGNTVTWVNADMFDHSIVAVDESFQSESLGDDDSFTHTFDVAGEYSYICGIHPYMTGSITVAG